MVLIDSSAWVQFLRDTGSDVCGRVDALLGDDIATCDAVRMEILAGARDGEHLNGLRRLLARASSVPIAPIDYDEAAGLHRICRRGGETVPKLIGCLIAATAIRANVPVLHTDRDFDVLARYTALQLDRPS